VKELRKAIVHMATQAGEGHIPSALSILDIVWVLYDRVMKFNPAQPDDPDRDRFILSKGHGSPALYMVLARKGFFPAEELSTFTQFHSRFGGHPDCNKAPGVEASTGSLGHGFPMGVGMALGLRIRHNPRHVYVVVGDAECNEGSVWEAALLAAHHNLANLTCIVDFNHSTDRALSLGNLEAKFAAFGWNAATVNGHDQEALFRAMTRTPDGHPSAIIAETIKGFGCAPMENNPAWHHRVPTADELPGILEALS